ncbi:MAG: class I SAM-dependent methyltransferase [Myxococcota bacterium]
MGLGALRYLGPLRPWALAGWRWDARSKIERIASYLNSDDRILDVGTGYGLVSDGLVAEHGFTVERCDVVDEQLADGPRPTLFDGRRLPYESDSYDVAMLLTVLHHVHDPEALLSEARRVARRLLIIEDVYSGPLQRRLTYAADSLFNFEFGNHPHSNRTDPEWRACFCRLSLEIEGFRSDRYLGLFRQNTYALSRVATSDV